MNHEPVMQPSPEAHHVDAALRLPFAVARRAQEFLATHGVQEARLEAELLLAAVLGVRRLDLYLDEDRPLADDILTRYLQAVDRRAKREPLQYIIGSVGFRELELRVDERALIPRPETEVLVGVVLEWSRARTREGGASLRALDIGTGTGAIALSLLAEDGFASVIATDVSEAALALARENAAALGYADRVDLRLGSVYEPAHADERFDAIVSNPPYIGTAERASLAPEVVDWEPASALFAGSDGLAVVEPIVRGAAARLARPGLLALEIAPSQAAAVAGLLRAAGFVRVRVVEDLAGRPRIVAGELET